MADPLVTDVLTDSQALLGESSSDGIYNNSMLMPFFGRAYRDVYNLMASWNLPLANRTAFAVLPAYTNVLSPAQIGITDFGEPQRVWERGSSATRTISAVADTTPVQITTSGNHGFSSNQAVQIAGVPSVNGVNGYWFITVTGNTTFTLNGSVAGGAATAGNVYFSSELFVPMIQRNPLPQITLGDRLTYFDWEGDTFNFVGSTQVRELKFEYSTSGAAPSSGNVGIDNSRDFLAYRTAALAAKSRDEDARANDLNHEALGDSMKPDGSGGLLRALCNPSLKAKQRVQRRKQSFRPRRNGIINGGGFQI